MEAAAIVHQLGNARFTARDWLQLADREVKRGRFPMLAFIPESGKELFRFAHLTFQEFLCAEHIRWAFEGGLEQGSSAAGFEKLMVEYRDELVSKSEGDRRHAAVEAEVERSRTNTRIQIAHVMSGGKPDLEQVFTAGSNADASLASIASILI